MARTARIAPTPEQGLQDPGPVFSPLSAGVGANTPWMGGPSVAQTGAMMGNSAAQDQLRDQGPAPQDRSDPQQKAAAAPEVQKSEQAQAGNTYVEPEVKPTRAQFMKDYKGWLGERQAELEKLPADQRAAATERLLRQVEDVSVRFNSGVYTDISKLQTSPVSDPGKPQKSSFVPPELIGSVRGMIKGVETPIAGAPTSADSKTEGSLYSGNDWNSRLGVPQYRTQSDNLASPEATCNVTSMSMVLERLGYNRGDVVSAVERELKTKYLKDLKRDPSKEDLSKVELPDKVWADTLTAYLKKNQGAGKTYQKLRGQETTDKQRKNIVDEYRDNAQMEDMLDVLLHLKGIDRTTITGNAESVLKAIEPDAVDRPTVTTINNKTFEKSTAQIDEALKNGGAVMLSLRHKGKGQTGTHLITIQAITPEGVIVDDPYGGMRTDYDAGKTGDAYADKGKTRGQSGYRNAVNRGTDANKDGVDDDWKVGSAQNPTGNESRGNSRLLPLSVLQSSMNYVSIYERPKPTSGGAAAP